MELHDHEVPDEQGTHVSDALSGSCFQKCVTRAAGRALAEGIDETRDFMEVGVSLGFGLEEKALNWPNVEAQLKMNISAVQFEGTPCR